MKVLGFLNLIDLTKIFLSSGTVHCLTDKYKISVDRSDRYWSWYLKAAYGHSPWILEEIGQVSPCMKIQVLHLRGNKTFIVMRILEEDYSSAFEIWTWTMSSQYTLESLTIILKNWGSARSKQIYGRVMWEKEKPNSLLAMKRGGTVETSVVMNNLVCPTQQPETRVMPYCDKSHVWDYNPAAARARVAVCGHITTKGYENIYVCTAAWNHVDAWQLHWVGSAPHTSGGMDMGELALALV